MSKNKKLTREESTDVIEFVKEFCKLLQQNIDIKTTGLYLKLKQTIDAQYISAIESSSYLPHFDLVLLGNLANTTNIYLFCYILAHRPNVNQKLPDGKTLLHKRIASSSSYFIKLLLAAGADVRDKDPQNCDALTLCMNYCRLSSAKLIIEKMLEIEDLLKNPILHILHSYTSDINAKGTMEIMEELFKKGANINWIGQGNASLLFKATNEQNHTMVKFYLKHGADASLQFNILKYGPLGQTRSFNALHLAAGFSDTKECYGKIIPNEIPYILTTLVTIGKLSINSKVPETSNTALHLATKKNNLHNIAKCLQLGANIDEKNLHGHTALHLAIRDSLNEAATILITHGANVNENNKDGFSILYTALDEANYQGAILLLNDGAIIDFKINGRPVRDELLRDIDFYPTSSQILIRKIVRLIDENTPSSSINEPQNRKILEAQCELEI